MLESPQIDEELLPRTGQLFAERYRIRALLGRGGYSKVYRATQIDLGREVAIKVLATGQRSSEKLDTAEKRFYREARLLSQLHSPNTLRMFDYGRSSDGLLFMVFEFIDGSDLRELIRRNGGIAPTRARGILIQILYSLREAHALSILHRDIKPANVMVFNRPGLGEGVKVLDFGIAKTVAAEANASRQLTMEGMVIGTPRYMSPEQALGRQLGPSSDLFSLGLLAYEMLVGQSPFDSSELSMIRRQLVSGPIRLPRTIKADDELRDAINRLLERRIEQRFQTANQVLAALGEEVEQANPEPARRLSSASRGLSFPLCLDSSGVAPVDDLTDTHHTAAAATTILDHPTTATTALDRPVQSATLSVDAMPPASEQRPDASRLDTRPSSRRLWPRLAAGVVIAAGAVGALMLWPEPAPRDASHKDQAHNQQAAPEVAEPATAAGRAVDACREQTISALQAAAHAASEEAIAKTASETSEADRTRARKKRPRRRPTRRTRPPKPKTTASETAEEKPAGFKPIDELL